jgi:pyrimidine deaminase RibD-like protein
MTNAELMAEALAESRKALPACRPNPPVGCVIVGADGRIIARGFTGRPGDPHAEAAALAQLRDVDPATLSLFTTLEPCAFAGRTPSCAKLIGSRGISAVCIGILDPHPRNSGRGAQLLRDAGVHVEVGILADDIRAFLAPYLLVD